jgi:hypothetical protein
MERRAAHERSMGMTDDDINSRPIGESFRGRSLDGADFTGTDVRGADFTGASLQSAIFRDARLGVAPRVGVVMLGVAILVTVVAGIAIGWSVDQTRNRLGAEQWDEVAEGGTVFAILVVFVGLVFWRGFDQAIRVGALLYVVAVGCNIVANFIWDEVEWFVVGRATALIVFITLAIAVGMIGRVVGGVFGAWSIAIVATLGGLASGSADGGAGGIVIAVSLVLISKRAVRGDTRDRTLRRVAHRLVGRWGTQFIDADLTGADFTGTNAGRCGVKGATLDGVTWDPKKPLPLDLPDDAFPPGRRRSARRSR